MNGPDPGLFGPDSVTWRVHADPTMGVAGLRALLLQALYPQVTKAVFEHSDFRADPWGRLRRTAEYVGTSTFGTTAAAHQAAAQVRAIHRRVPGADNPDLLRWVHCCEIDSFLGTARRAGLRLSKAEADRYVEEQVDAARLIGAEGAPACLVELRRYFEDVRPALALTAEATEAARFVLFPPMRLPAVLAPPARAAWVGLSALGFALLPRWARRMYRLPGLPTTDLGATLAVRGLRIGLLAAPPALREGPHHKAARLRMHAAAWPG